LEAGKICIRSTQELSGKEMLVTKTIKLGYISLLLVISFSIDLRTLFSDSFKDIAIF